MSIVNYLGSSGGGIVSSSGISYYFAGKEAVLCGNLPAANPLQRNRPTSLNIICNYLYIQIGLIGRRELDIYYLNTEI